jgi:hypothetical protein
VSNRIWLPTYIVAFTVSFLAGGELGGRGDRSRAADDPDLADARPTSVLEDDRVITASPRVLAQAYARNAVAADYAFQGKTVELTGVAGPIHHELSGLGGYLLMAAAEHSGEVLARFEGDSSSALATLTAGEPATVRCQVWGKMIFVILEQCSVVPSSGAVAKG